MSNAKHRLADAEDVHAFCRAARLSVQVAPALHAALKAKAAQHTQVKSVYLACPSTSRTRQLAMVWAPVHHVNRASGAANIHPRRRRRRRGGW